MRLVSVAEEVELGLNFHYAIAEWQVTPMLRTALLAVLDLLREFFLNMLDNSLTNFLIILVCHWLLFTSPTSM